MYGKKAGYKTVGSIFMLNIQREFHVVQWLGLGTLTARGPGSIPDQGTEIMQVVWLSQPKVIIQTKH